MKLDTPVEHLLVDLDGTLLANRMLPLKIDFISRALGALSKYGGIRKAASTLLAIKRQLDLPSREFTNDRRVLEIFAQRMNLTVEQSKVILKELITTIFPPLKKHFTPVPGAKEFLEWAKDRYPMTLATNPVWPVEIIELRVKWAGIEPSIFKTITHVDRMHACKPAAEYYEEILAQQGLDASKCLLIGDDVKMDLPATRVGIPVFIVGRHSEVTPLKLKGSKALAWKGSFRLLREALEAKS